MFWMLECLLITASLLCGVLLTCCLNRQKPCDASSPCATKPSGMRQDLSTVLIITHSASGIRSVALEAWPTCNVGRLLKTYAEGTPHPVQKSVRMASQRRLDVYS
jgi:hypothetical protein